MGIVRDGEDKPVGRELERLLDLAVRVELGGQLCVGGGEDVDLAACADLGRELVRAGELEAHAGEREVRGVCGQGAAKGRSRRDDQLGARIGCAATATASGDREDE